MNKYAYFKMMGLDKIAGDAPPTAPTQPFPYDTSPEMWQPIRVGGRNVWRYKNDHNVIFQSENGNPPTKDVTVYPGVTPSYQQRQILERAYNAFGKMDRRAIRLQKAQYNKAVREAKRKETQGF